MKAPLCVRRDARYLQREDHRPLRVRGEITIENPSSPPLSGLHSGKAGVIVGSPSPRPEDRRVNFGQKECERAAHSGR